MNTKFGWSLGASPEKKETLGSTQVFTQPVKLHAYTAILKEKSEPTMLVDNDTPDMEEIIKESIMVIFEAEQPQADLTDRKSPETFRQEIRGGHKEYTADETFAVEQFKTRVEKKNGRYYIRPLFREEFQPMKNNYHIPLKRYSSLRTQLKRGPKLEQMYSDAIETMIKNE